MKTNCAIIGYFDNLALFLEYNLSKYSNFKNKLFISYEKLPKNISQKDKKFLTSNKVEFVKNNKLGKTKIIYEKNFLPILKKNKIKNVFIAIGDGKIREKIFKIFNKTNIKVNSFIHPTAILAGKNEIGKGCIIYPNTYLGYKVRINDCVKIQSSVTIEHHSFIDSFVDINPGVVTGGNVRIGKFCELGLSSTILNKVHISENCIIGAKSLVLKSIQKKNKIIYGIPGKIHEKKKNKN